MNNTVFRILLMSAVLVASLAGVAKAADSKVRDYKKYDWSFSGPFGKYDNAAMQRGFQVYREVCAQCHSIDLVSFRNLGQKGGPFYMAECPEGFPDTVNCSNPNDNPIVKAFAAEYTITDGPDDEGDMFERPGLPSDRIPGPYPNEQTAAAANGGAIPPDFSLLTKARKDGPNYIYSLLTGYETPPETIAVPAGQYYNPYYAGETMSLVKPDFLDHGHLKEGIELPYGGVFKMAPPLSDGIITYEDGSPETIEQYASDVVNFMMWAAEPKLESRKKMGVMVLIYLLIFAIITYMSYKRIWARVE